MLKKLTITGFFIVSVCPFFGQTSGHRIAQIIQKSPNGTTAQVIPYARVLICTNDQSCSTVPVYQDPGLTTQYVQPLTADASGTYNYYVAPGCYKEQILSPGSPSRFIEGVCLSAPNGAGSGTVTLVSIAPANGFTGSVANPSSTPTITISVDGSHYLPLQTDVSNWNGKQAALGYTPQDIAAKGNANGYAGLDSSARLSAVEFPAFTGDVTSSAGTTLLSLPAVNGTPGTCGDATHICQITTNNKGLTTAQSSIALNGITSLSVSGLSPLFTTNVANPTSTPSVTFTQLSVNQNSIYAGPPSGGPGVPTFQTAPTFSAANLSLFSSSVAGVVSASGGGTTNFLRADGTWAVPAGGSMVYPAAGIANSTGSAWGTSYSSGNLIPSNFLPIATTGSTGVVKPDGTTVTVDVDGTIHSIGISGLTTGYLPQATSSTTIGNSFMDYGVTNAGAYTSTKDIYAPSFHATDASGAGFGFMGVEGTAPTGVAGSDGLWADSTAHRLMMNNNNAGALTIVGNGTAATAGHIAVFSTGGRDIEDSGVVGITASGTSCTITAITNGIISGATCTP